MTHPPTTVSGRQLSAKKNGGKRLVLCQNCNGRLSVTDGKNSNNYSVSYRNNLVLYLLSTRLVLHILYLVLLLNEQYLWNLISVEIG